MNATPGMPSSESPQLNFALLVLRVACALPFLYHGSGILFGVLGGPGPVNFAAFMHVPAAVGYLVGLAQFRHQSQRVRICALRTAPCLRLADCRPGRLFAPKRFARTPPQALGRAPRATTGEWQDSTASPLLS